MNRLHFLTKPYYTHRPAQLWQRLKFAFRKPPRSCWVELPWGLCMLANPDNDLGHALQTTGINDLTVSECLFRLADPGELAVDVGANVGYTTSILSVAVGSSGRVISFEPHPTLHAELCASIARWQTERSDLAEVTVINQAVSDKEGESVLNEPASFDANRGISTLQPQSEAEHQGREIRVKTVPLDTLFASGEIIGVLKVDVEGHEAQVFNGAIGLLSSGRVRDVLFEEFAPYPTGTHQILEEHGFKIFVVAEHTSGPLLIPAHSEWKPPAYSPPNYVATRDVDRLGRRFQTKGWICLTEK